MSIEKLDVIIVGGSYSGLAAGMGLGRALRKVLIIDSGMPANRFTPQSHNFLTHDGRSPSEIASIAAAQVDQYKSIRRIQGTVVSAEKDDDAFELRLDSDATYRASKLIFATGIIDLMPATPGFAECWGKSVLHCPYCHGYEVQNVRSGILGNGDYAFEFGSLISNWTNDLTIYTDGPSTLTKEQTTRMLFHNIRVIENPIDRLEHRNGYVEKIIFKDGRGAPVSALYARPRFKQHSDLPAHLGCEITDEGYLKVDPGQRTTIPGVYACGDNTTRMRTVANAISMGTTAAITLNKDMIQQAF